MDFALFEVEVTRMCLFFYNYYMQPRGAIYTPIHMRSARRIACGDTPERPERCAYAASRPQSDSRSFHFGRDSIYSLMRPCGGPCERALRAAQREVFGHASARGRDPWSRACPCPFAICPCPFAHVHVKSGRTLHINVYAKHTRYHV